MFSRLNALKIAVCLHRECLPNRLAAPPRAKYAQLAIKYVAIVLTLIAAGAAPPSRLR